MTIEQITEWIVERNTMRRSTEYIDDNHYRISYPNGDTYEFCQVFDGMFDKTVTIKINGETANISRYTWDGNVYGWKQIA